MPGVTAGPAARADYLPFALPDYGPEELAAVREVLESGWVSTGERTHRFESEFARFVGARNAVAVNSGTAALHLALEAIGLDDDDEVITTPYTFAATAEVIRYFRARPVFVDVDPMTLNLDPRLAAAAMTGRTRAILPVHIAGLPCAMDAILELAARAGIAVVEDAAHAFPAKYAGRTIGTLSDFTCFSFYATKPLATGEGGMICTEDDQRAARCRLMALHGISRDAWRRYTTDGNWYYEVIAPGFKYNLTDIAAALGLVQLRRATAMAARRAAIAAVYHAAFDGLDCLQVPSMGQEGDQHAWHLYMLRLRLDRLTVERAEFVSRLRDRGVGVSVHFIPLHLHPYYRDRYGHQPCDFPVAHAEYLREVSLPIYSRMSDTDVDRVTDAVLAVARECRR